MAKNILIFSDGTGQAGGIAFDENRSNIYKLYRATRVGPDSCINPNEQLAYYDAGLGALPPGGGSIRAVYRWIYNFLSQATGFGLTANIVDCYQVIAQRWQPGDRIYLFGFSRGAYTVRCLAAALALCGVPTKMKDGSPLRRDAGSIRRIAKHAIKTVYQHTTSMHYPHADKRTKELLDQRKQLAATFRATYGADDLPSASPYFVGVFDTVAAVANPSSKRLLLLLLVAAVIVLAGLSKLWGGWPFWISLLVVSGITALACGVVYLYTHVKWEIGLKRKWRVRLFHFAVLRMRDLSLSNTVVYAKEALAIDENRADFDRAKWGTKGVVRLKDDLGNETFEQVWFAGNHSDIGGSYPEVESRLSDIALEWMVNAATSIPHPIKIDRTVLRLYPSSDGMQHDETKAGLGLLSRLTGITWSVAYRDLSDHELKLHKSVFERLDLQEVQIHDVIERYSPTSLKVREELKDHPSYRDVSA